MKAVLLVLVGLVFCAGCAGGGSGSSPGGNASGNTSAASQPQASSPATQLSDPICSTNPGCELLCFIQSPFLNQTSMQALLSDALFASLPSMSQTFENQNNAAIIQEQNCISSPESQVNNPIAAGETCAQQFPAQSTQAIENAYAAKGLGASSEDMTAVYSNDLIEVQYEACMATL